MKKYLLGFLGFLPILSVTAQKQTEVPIKLPAGFSSQIVASNFGRVRHIAVNTNGDLYMKLDRLVNGKGIYRLRDKNKDGIMEDTLAFGNYTGTGIGIYRGYLYATSDETVYRYQLDANQDIVNPDKPEIVIEGLLNQRQHASKSITFDQAGNIYVNIGAPSNVCQEKDRQKGSPGMTPCPILENAGGIWQFSTTKLNQILSDGVRYATGMRNALGIDWNQEVNDLYVTIHGRDMLFQYFPEMYDQKKGAELPSETFYRVKKGDDCGWPYVHWDHFQNKKILNPEYGGDGKKEGAPNAISPLVGFPGHMAPNALLMYSGNQFPAKYKYGAFIAFHGSWNRTPEPQEGFYVVFVPMKNGMPTGNWEVFADGFSGMSPVNNLSAAKHRPTGLAMGPDGSVYVSDDKAGYVWKITHNK